MLTKKILRQAKALEELKQRYKQVIAEKEKMALASKAMLKEIEKEEKYLKSMKGVETKNHRQRPQNPTGEEKYINAGMTQDEFEERITRIQGEAAVTSAIFTSSINAIGDGIANQLVDGTYEWRDAWKAVLKQVVATAAQVVIIQGLMGAMTGGTSLFGGGLLGALGGGKFHQGGVVPRHHFGVLSRNEHPAILEAGEFVLRKQAVKKIGAESLQAMNRSGSVPANNFNVTINVNAAGTNDPRKLAQQIAEPLREIIRREAGRGISFS